tara:strand:+ start:606 stop:2240 length:1635 start_codon:yes stop_codon:yes gene_type:complete
MKTAVVDIETDGFDATKTHCIVAITEDNKEHYWTGDDCFKFKDWSKNIDQFIMHNGISFDAPVLNKLIGTNIQMSQIRDTLIESQLFNPIREGGHSLKAWGKKLNYRKFDYDNFDAFTLEMLEYCKQDTRLTKKVSEYLEIEGKTFSKKSYELEKKVRCIIDKQQDNGYAFNIKDASILLAQLEDEQTQLENKAQELFPPKQIQLKTKTKEIPFNIASRKQISERLQEKGWKPTEFTEKENIIINEKVLSTIDMPEAKMFSRYFLLQKRTGLLKSWIKECKDTNRVHGKVMTLQTVTGRMAHSSPNMAQVPAVYSPYGKECRRLWTVDNIKTHKLVGVDASGLELRCLAHYMDDANFTEEVLSGDIHTANQQAAGLKTRDEAKTFIYAFLYGAGPNKIAKILNSNVKEASNVIDRFLSNLPKLNQLREKVFNEASRKQKIIGLDGRYLHIRHAHAALNTLLQSAGAIICKQWLIEIIKRVDKYNLDAKLVASVHDEYQFEVVNKDIPMFCELAKQAIYNTKDVLNVKCDLDCDYKVGNNWAETH